jgi:hypothetical protein
MFWRDRAVVGAMLERWSASAIAKAAERSGALCPFALLTIAPQSFRGARQLC